MRRILLLVSLAAMMATILALSALPALASPLPAKGACGGLEQAFSLVTPYPTPSRGSAAVEFQTGAHNCFAT